MEFITVKLDTDPSPIRLTITPIVTGSTQIQLQLDPLPFIRITATKDENLWQFLGGVAEIIIEQVSNDFLARNISSIEEKAQEYLNENAAFDVPPIPVSVEGVDITLTPSDLEISAYDNDYVMVSGSVTIS